jgi:hypothetical protein
MRRVLLSFWISLDGYSYDEGTELYRVMQEMQALTDLGARIRTDAVPDGLPFSHDATSLAAAEVWNLVCAESEFYISFHPSGFAGGYAQLAVNAHRLRVGDVEVVVADLADVIQSKESAGRPKDLRVLPLLYRHLSGVIAGLADEARVLGGGVRADRRRSGRRRTRSGWRPPGSGR